MNGRNLTWIGLLALALAASAYAEPSEKASEKARGKSLAEVTLKNGRVIHFNELQEGVLVVESMGQAGTPPVLTRDLIGPGKKPADVFRNYAPGKPVPPGLLRAQERVDRMRAEKDKEMKGERGKRPANAEDDSAKETQGEADPAPKAADEDSGIQERSNSTTGSSSCSESWFLTTFCSDENSGANSWCWTRRTNGSSIQRSSVGMYSVVCPYRGRVRLDRYMYKWWAWEKIFSRSVPQGSYVETWMYDFFAGAHRSRVTEASGDGFHHSGYWLK